MQQSAPTTSPQSPERDPPYFLEDLEVTLELFKGEWLSRHAPDPIQNLPYRPPTVHEVQDLGGLAAAQTQRIDCTWMISLIILHGAEVTQGELLTPYPLSQCWGYVEGRSFCR